MNDVELSVVIPCYNDGEYLSEAVESILNQNSSVKKFEIIIVDDSSDDLKTRHVLSKWYDQNDCVHVIKNIGPKGPSGTRNTGIRRAKGEWIGFLDADDVWVSDSLEIRWQVIQEMEGVCWVGADFKYLYEDGSISTECYYETRPIAGQILKKAFKTNTPLKLVKPVQEMIDVYLAFTGTVLVKRDYLIKVGCFDESLIQSEDLLLWTNLALNIDFVFIPLPLVLYRQHNSSLTHTDAKLTWQIKAYGKMFKDPRFSKHKSLIKVKLLAYSDEEIYNNRGQRKFFAAVKSSLRSIRIDVCRFRGWKNLLASLLFRE